MRILPLFVRPGSARPSSRRRIRSGNMVTELVMAYGAQALLIALALGLLVGVYTLMSRNTLSSDITSVSTALSAVAGVDDWTGFTTSQVAGVSGLPERVINSAGTGLVFGGDDLAAHFITGAAKKAGTTGKKHFILQIGDTSTIMDSETCQDIASSDFRGLRGITIAAAAAGGTAPGDEAALPGTAAIGAIATWTRNATNSSPDLSTRTRGIIAQWCDVMTAGASVYLGFD